MIWLSTGAAIGRARYRRRAAMDETEGESACRFIESLVASVLGVALGDIRSDGRGRAAVVSARHAAMYLAHVGLGICLSRVAEHFGRDRTTVAYACARMEDRRDNPRIDCVLACLEAALHTWRKGAFSDDAS